MNILLLPSFFYRDIGAIKIGLHLPTREATSTAIIRCIWVDYCISVRQNPTYIMRQLIIGYRQC